jgi:hypothetical protein
VRSRTGTQLSFAGINGSVFGCCLITRKRGDMLALARQMKMDDLVPRALESCPAWQ